MAWITDQQLKDKLIAVLQKASLEVDAPWDEIIPDANKAAYDDIVEPLLKRGYTIDQIDSWDARTTYNIDIGLFWCLVKGGCTKDFDETFIMLLDRRAKLETLEIILDGEIVVPETLTGSGTIKSGAMESDLDHFTIGAP